MLDGKPIISLPPKTVSLKMVDFTSEERSFYNNLEAESREQFKVSSQYLWISFFEIYVILFVW
jgi:SNF2 family DNA or RNA helicase